MQHRVGIADVVRPAVGGRVVDEALGHALAESSVLARVQDEGVPADVDEVAGRQGHPRIVSACLHERQRLGDDALSERARDLLVADDARDQALERRSGTNERAETPSATTTAMPNSSG